MSGFPEIWTSSWSTTLPLDFVRIGISRSTPRRQSGFRRYMRLCPGPWFNSVSEVEYINRYETDILGAIEPNQLLADIINLAGDRPSALLCFEHVSEGQWCHRALAARFIFRETGVQIREYGHAGFGDEHPMLPPTLRAAR